MATATKSKNRIRDSAISAAIVTALLVTPHAGFMLHLVVPPLLIWLSYSLYVAAKYPERRRSQTIRAGIWVGAVLLVVAVHAVRHHSTRTRADAVAAQIESFAAKNGRCPASLDEAGFGEAQLRQALGSMAFYACEDGKPQLSYPVTYIVFDRYDYDFDGRRWTYRAW